MQWHFHPQEAVGGSVCQIEGKHSSSKFESLLNGCWMALPIPWGWNWQWQSNAISPLVFHGKATLCMVSWGPKCHLLNNSFFLYFSTISSILHGS
jgi:hypothetical protein